MAPRIAVAALLAWLVAVPAAHADDAEQARIHYRSASSHFAVGEFAEAAEEYQIAYKLKPDPALLYNAAQSYRLAGNNDKALILYKNYLQFFPNESNADDVRQQIAKLKEAIAATEKAKTSPPTNTVEPGRQSPPAATVITPTPASASTQIDVRKTEAPHKTPLYKRWWVWTAVGVVVVGGVVTAAVLATRPAPAWSNVNDFGPGVGGLTFSR